MARWQDSGTMADRIRSTPPRHRSGISTLVLSRPAPRTDGVGARPVSLEPQRRWPMVVTWIVLGGLIAALWALLLLGDSLVPTEAAALAEGSRRSAEGRPRSRAAVAAGGASANG